MKRLILLAVFLVALVNPALAYDYDQDLNISLVKPSSQAYLNIESCATPEEIELEISWNLPDGSYTWLGEQDADVFLAIDENCSSAEVEIGKVVDKGVDVTISEGQTSGSFPLSGDELFLSDVTGLDCATENEHDYYFCIKWKYVVDQITTTDNYTFRGGAPIRFDTKKPGAPTITSIDPGETNLKVKWDKPSDDDLDSYIIHYRQEGTTDDHQADETNGEATSFQITGLTNDVNYEVWMTAVDTAMNESEESNTMTGTPEPVEDFFEYYRGQGGGDQGGFCFVATAAYGSCCRCAPSGTVFSCRARRDAAWSRLIIVTARAGPGPSAAPTRTARLRAWRWPRWWSLPGPNWPWEPVSCLCCLRRF